MEFHGKLILAPLAGITDTTFRLLCRENGADAVLTEMASAPGLIHQPARTARYLEFVDAERPIGAQIFGAKPAEIARAAAEIGRMGFDFVDINMGCPVRKVTSGGAGAALLADPAKAGEIARAAVEACGIPVTAKIRSGFGTDDETYLDVAQNLFRAGVAAVTHHPRTRGQMFAGRADWSQIARLKRLFPDRVVVGNGDVRTPEDAVRMRAETGCDAVMVGRAALGDPWIFAAMKAALFAPAGVPGAALPSPEPSPSVRRLLILRHGEEMHRRWGESGIRQMRKHLAWYCRGRAGAASFRAELPHVTTLGSFRDVVGRFF